MTPTLTFNLAAHRHAMNQLVANLNANGRELLKEEMRLLLRDILQFTPPTRSPKSDDVKQTARQRGQTAIENDMRRVAAPLFWKEIQIPELAEAVYRRDIPRIQAIIKNIPAFKNRTIYTSVADLQAAHMRRRNRYGRVRGKADAVAFGSDWTKYTRTLKQRVGWTRAGWWKAAQALGVPLPKWVARHTSYAPSGYFAPRPSEMAITAINRSVKIPNYEARHVLPALNRRAKSLVSEAERLLAGGKSRRASFSGTSTGTAD